MKRAPKKGAGTKAKAPQSTRGGTSPTKRGSTPRPPPSPATRAAPPRGWAAAAAARNTERLAALERAERAERAAAAARSERAQRAAETRRQNAAAERAAAAERSERAQRAAATRRRNAEAAERAAAAAERAAAAARSERARRAAETRRQNAAAERAAAAARSERAQRAAATRRQNAIDLAEIRRLRALDKEERRAEGRRKAAETRARKKAEKAAAEAAKAAAEAAEAAEKAEAERKAALLPRPDEYELGQGKFRRLIVTYSWPEEQLPRSQLVIEVGGNVLELMVCNPGPELQAWIRERLDEIVKEHADDPAAIFWIRIHSVNREITAEGEILNEEDAGTIQTTGLGIAPGDERDVRNQGPEWAGRTAEKQRARSPSRKRGGGAPEETEETEEETEEITVIDRVEIQIQRTIRMVGVTP